MKTFTIRNYESSLPAPRPFPTIDHYSRYYLSTVCYVVRYYTMKQVLILNEMNYTNTTSIYLTLLGT